MHFFQNVIFAKKQPRSRKANYHDQKILQSLRLQVQLEEPFPNTPKFFFF